MAPCAQI